MRVKARFCFLSALLLIILSLQAFPLSYDLENNVNCNAVKLISLRSFSERIRILHCKKIIPDTFHIASQRKIVDIDQRKYFGVDENGDPINPNPTYGEAYRYQPSFSLRLGIEVGF